MTDPIEAAVTARNRRDTLARAGIIPSTTAEGVAQMSTHVSTEIDNDAREYWDTLAKPANGWGQHIHPRYGMSHAMLMHMINKWGEFHFKAALDRQRPQKESLT